MIKQVQLKSYCPNFAEAFDILGRKWNGLIIETMMLNGSMRFMEVGRIISRCSDRMISERLRELEEAKIIKRILVGSNVEYTLTERGLDMKGFLDEIHAWSDKWQDDEQEA